jgi:hypothetical protein
MVLAASAAGFRLRLGDGVALRLRSSRLSACASLSPLADRRPKPRFINCNLTIKSEMKLFPNAQKTFFHRELTTSLSTRKQVGRNGITDEFFNRVPHWPRAKFRMKTAPHQKR